ncbi:hypothetical protein [Streptomyces sp. CB03238]|uniref:hypothetical protein n=1 Tax=Streptomyces sp. CB03238 TaxID=1907777 RepID=UPI00321A5E6A
MCSSTSTMPIAAKPSAPAIPNGCQARTPSGVVRTAADRSPPVASMTRTSPAGVVPGSALISKGT